MADWYVFQHDTAHLGPYSTEVVANAILAGRLSPEVWVAAPGGLRWLRALDVPVIAQLVDGMPTRRRSGMQLVTPQPQSHTPTRPLWPSARTSLRGTVMLVRDDEITEVPTPRRGSGALRTTLVSGDRRKRRREA